MFEEEKAAERRARDEELFNIARRNLNDFRPIKHNSFFGAEKAATNREAVDLILEFYGLNYEMLSHLENQDIIYRELELTGEWWRSAGDPLICRNSNDEYTALIPSHFSGYYYIDPSGHKITINSGNQLMFPKALNFCKRFPDGDITLKTFIDYIRNFISKSDVLFLCILGAFSVAAGTIIPHATDIMMKSKDMNIILAALFVMVSASVYSVCANAGISLLKKRVLQRSNYSIRNAIVMRILQMDSETTDRLSKSRLMGFVYDMYDLSEKIIEIIPGIILLSLFVLTYTVQASNYIGSAVLWILLLILIQTGMIYLLCRRYKASSREMYYGKDNESDTYAMLARGLLKIQQMNAEKRMFAKWAETYRNYTDNAIKTHKLENLNGILPAVISKLIAFAVIVFALVNHLEVSAFFAINMIVGLLIANTSELLNVILSIEGCKVKWERSEPIRLKVECKERRWLPGSFKSISIENLSFTYKDSGVHAIKNLSLKVKTDEYLAIVGRSGEGKSTLANLMMGKLYPDKGSIMYGRYLLTPETRFAIIRNLRYVSQSDVLIPGTIRDNMEMCAGFVKDSEIWDALEKMDIADFVRRLPYGLDTKINSEMIAFSQGQVQRLILARAIISNPKMLILDEATSALDNISQKKIRDALDRMPCTKIVIAHRLSTVKYCDRILLLEDGRIKEEGSYAELMDKKGRFYELVKLQENSGEPD